MESPILSDGTPSAFFHPIDALIPLQAVAHAVRADHPYLVWLDSARAHPVTGRSSMLGWDPWVTLTSHGADLTVQTSVSTVSRREHPMTALRQLAASYRTAPVAADAPVVPGLFLACAYELNGWLERLPPAQPEALARVPELWAAGMRQMIVVDHEVRRSWCVSVVDPHQPAGRARQDARARLEAMVALVDSLGDADAPLPPRTAPAHPAAALEPMMDQAAFEAMVRRAKTFITQGDIFQANLSQAFSASWCRSPWPLYLALRAINPSPFAAFVQHPEFSLVSCSPERLVRVQDGVASTRPIAGTRPRGTDSREDALNSLELLLSDKERAEHIMLVDLERNDLGRICRPGSVQVDELMAVEGYSHVMHIVSNAWGRLQPGLDAVDVLRAMFPGGTITGCPKIRCMQLLRELEPVRRGFYTGSCGFLGFDGRLDLNILIRTMVLQHGRLSLHAGAGIVADSQPDREYHETLAKAEALVAALRSAATESQDAGVH